MNISNLKFNDLMYYLEDYQKELYNVIHMATEPSKFNGFARYKDDYVFYVVKSVKWNREQVKIENQKYEDEKIRLSKLKIETENKIKDEIAEMLFKLFKESRYYTEINLTLNQLKILVNYAVEYAPDNYDPQNIFEYIILNLNLAVDLVDFNPIGGE